MDKLKKEAILNDFNFKLLSAQKRTYSLILTIMELGLYFGFIALIAYNKPFMAQKLEGQATTFGILIAVGTIAISVGLAGLYVWWAKIKYDPLMKKIMDSHGL